MSVRTAADWIPRLEWLIIGVITIFVLAYFAPRAWVAGWLGQYSTEEGAIKICGKDNIVVAGHNFHEEHGSDKLVSEPFWKCHKSPN
jgi:hypothetical protein